MNIKHVFIVFLLFSSPSSLGGMAASLWQLDDMTPLMRAANDGDTAEIDKLLMRGVDVNEINSAGATPLIFAASKGKLEAVKFLLKKGADPNICATHSMCPLWYATDLNNKKVLITAGAKAYVNPDRNALEHPSLHKAAARNQVDIMELLLNNGADINFSDYYGGNTALAMAVRLGKYEAAKLLIDRGAALYEVTHVPYFEGKTAFEIANEEGFFDVTQLVRNSQKSGGSKEAIYSVDSIIAKLYKDSSYDISKQNGKIINFLRRQSVENLRLIRNAIFARKNYKFDDVRLTNYFVRTFSSYRPLKKNISMSEVDKSNVSLLKEIEDYAKHRDAAG